MDKKELEERTKRFALRIIRFVAAPPKNTVTSVMGYQLVKAGTSIGSKFPFRNFHCRLVVDTRNATREVMANSARIVSL